MIFEKIIEIAKYYDWESIFRGSHKHYTPEKYPTYDTYDAIHIEYYNEIPYDTDKIMGVPITYLAYHCDEQFEILGKFDGGTASNDLDLAKPIINGKAKYKRIAIKRRNFKPEECAYEDR